MYLVLKHNCTTDLKKPHYMIIYFLSLARYSCTMCMTSLLYLHRSEDQIIVLMDYRARFFTTYNNILRHWNSTYNWLQKNNITIYTEVIKMCINITTEHKKYSQFLTNFKRTKYLSFYCNSQWTLLSTLLNNFFFEKEL